MLATNILDIRVPTTTRTIKPENAAKVLADIRPGDVFVETNNAYPNWQRMEFLTMGACFTHAAMYEGLDQKGEPMLLEATTGDPSGAGVIRTNLKEYFHGPVQLAIVRPQYATPEDREAALGYMREQLGKPYDSKFDFANDDAFACTELVSKALAHMPHPIEVEKTRVLGRDAVAPDSFMTLPNAEVIYTDNASFTRNMASHWPIAAAALTTGAASWALSGNPILGAAGFLGGLFGSIAVGNKIQTGHFNLSGMGK
jgi:hypothetical protein